MYFLPDLEYFRMQFDIADTLNIGDKLLELLLSYLGVIRTS